MKIGLVSSDPFCFPGGIQEHVKGLYRFLNSNGHDAKIIAPRYKEEEDYGKDVILVGDSSKFSWNASKGVISYCFNMKKLKEILDREDFDVLHFHNPGIFTSLEILIMSDSINVITLHSLPDYSLHYRLNTPLIRLVSKTVKSKFAGVIVLSEATLSHYKFLKKHFKDRMMVIPSGIDTERFKPENKKIDGFLDGKKNILFVGRIEKRKGLPYLIDAFEQVKREIDDVRLIIVGDGDKRDEYEETVKKKNLKDVVFVGSQDEKNMPGYYATADIFCSPAVRGEGFGIVLLEAMASGKPVVASANRGYREVLRNYDRRFLVKPESTQSLARALLTLIKDEKLRKRLGLWGLKESKKYSWNVVGKKILSFYERISHNMSK